MLFDPPAVVGVLLDISYQQQDSVRILDEVKAQLVEFVNSFDDEHELYLYHPDLIDVLTDRGEQTAVIANYETDGYRFDLDYALKKVTYIISGKDPSMRRVVIIVTDRLNKKSLPAVEKILTINDREDLGCEYWVFAIGDKFEAALSTTCSNSEYVKFDRLDNAKALSSILKDRLNENNNRSETN